MRLLTIRVTFLNSSGMEAELEIEILGGSQSFCSIRQNLVTQAVPLGSLSYHQANRGKKMQGRLETPKDFEQIFCWSQSMASRKAKTLWPWLRLLLEGGMERKGFQFSQWKDLVPPEQLRRGDRLREQDWGHGNCSGCTLITKKSLKIRLHELKSLHKIHHALKQTLSYFLYGVFFSTTP